MEDKNQVAYIYCSKEGTPLLLAGKFDVGCKLVVDKEVSSLGLNFKLEFKYE